MNNTKQYLDYVGLKTYHDELIRRLTDLEYDPERMFEDKKDLFDEQKWGKNKYDRIVGLKAGLIITVGSQIWQLVNPDTFITILTGVQPIEDKILIPVEDLGWKIVGNTVDYDISDHTLILTK